MKEDLEEVEYLMESKNKIDESKEILFDFLNNLGIRKELSITKSYLELIIDKINSWDDFQNTIYPNKRLPVFVTKSPFF